MDKTRNIKNRAIMALFKIIFIFSLIHQSKAIQTVTFPIGALFNNDLNNDTLIVYEKLANRTGGVYTGRTLKPQVDDNFSASLDICKITAGDQGIAALIDVRPTEGVCDMICLLCNLYNIPHLSLGWQLPDTMAQNKFTFSFHPPPDLISKAYAVLIKELQWDKFTVFYEDDSSFYRLQEVINNWPHDQDPILYRKIIPQGDNKETFKHIFKVARMTFHILDCHVDNIKSYLKEIIEVENSTQYQSFIFTSLDAYTVNLDSIPDWMANVSTIHLARANEVRWMDMKMIHLQNFTARLETALMYDAMNHLALSLATMQSNKEDMDRLKNDRILPPLCYRNIPLQEYTTLEWKLGTELQSAILSTTSDGTTGKIQFDEYGKRSIFNLHLSKLNKDSEFIYTGYWDSTTEKFDYVDKLVSDRSSAYNPKAILRIASLKGAPYFEVINENGTEYFRGFAVDLMTAIFEHIKVHQKKELKFEFYRVANDKYGNPIAGTKKWDGLIGELLEHRADMGICDLTITSERIAAVDFSTPFMSLGISMLFKKPDPEAPDMFSFLLPLALDVWLYLATTYIVVSFILLICARMCNGDWVNPHPCNPNPENLENIWSLYNCLWLTMGSIMTQGCDILPRAGGSRWVTGMWWFFAMIITASYTANMSTFLSNSRRSNEIKDVVELSEQNKVSYGAVYNASTFKFFKNSKEKVYQKIYSTMESTRPSVYTQNNAEGKDRVLRGKGKYVFFMENTGIEYYTEKYCNLKMVGPKLDSKDYGIAFPKNSPYKSYVDTAILALQEKMDLDKLKKKWWTPEKREGDCEDTSKKKEDDDGSLQMENTSGIFLVLGVGTIIGAIVAGIDFMMHAWKICVKENVLFKEALASEWKASLNPRSLHKPAAPPRSAAPTASPSPRGERAQSRAASVLKAASSFINFDEIY